jgi:hypothetical protein
MENQAQYQTTAIQKHTTNYLAQIPTTELETITRHKNGIKIRDFKAQNFKELEVWILTLSNLIGVKISPSKEQIQLIVKVVKTGFKDFSREEMGYAFELALAKVLEVDTKHYQALTPDYVTDVLAAYRKHRNKSLYEEEKRKKAEEADKVLVRSEKYDQEMHEGFLKIIKQTNKMPIAWDWTAVFKYMEFVGDIRMSKEDKEMFADTVKAEMEEAARGLRITEGKDASNKALSELNNKDFFSNECRKRYLKIHFNL